MPANNSHEIQAEITKEQYEKLLKEIDRNYLKGMISKIDELLKPWIKESKEYRNFSFQINIADEKKNKPALS